jgi:hypothetical protein
MHYVEVITLKMYNIIMEAGNPYFVVGLTLIRTESLEMLYTVEGRS